MIPALFFAGSALVALLGLCAVALHDVPRFTGSVAFIVTLAALAVALVR